MKVAARWSNLLVICSLLVFYLPPAVVRAEASRPAKAAPVLSGAGLETALNPDGSLRASAAGSFNAGGWQMHTSSDGSPRFERAGAPKSPLQAGDPNWDGRFLNGVSNGAASSQVYAIAISGSDVYVGGSFSQAGGVAANNIARWSSATHLWYPLAGGALGQVFAILVSGSSVIIGGSFNDLNGQSAWSLGRWDTAAQTWSLVGGTPGLQSGGTFVGVVQALAMEGTDLIVAGSFDHAGSVAARNIARWSGSAWSALGGGLGTSSSDVVFALAVSGTEIFAGGSFTNPFSNITRWDGASWLEMGGTGGPVRALALNGNNLYVGGSFAQVGGSIPAANMAVWMGGTTWQAAGAGTDGEVYSLMAGGGGYFVGGSFLNAGGASANHAAFWNGSAWSALANGVDSTVYSLAVSGSDVYVGGDYTLSDFGLNNIKTNRIGRWDINSAAWYTLGNGLDEPVLAVAIQGSDVYVGGTFTSAGGVAVHNIARWSRDTGAWSDLSGGVTGCTGVFCTPRVRAIVVSGNTVYVGGQFTMAGPFAASSLATWNTFSKTWNNGFVGACGNCLPPEVYALALDGIGVDVGGQFTIAGCIPGCITVNNVVHWDGFVTYTPFSDGVTVGTNDLVHAIQPDGAGGVYFGGNFTSPRAHLVYFDGVNWLGPGSPLNDFVFSLALDNQYLYAGGLFLNAGGSGANKIARLSMLGPGDWQPLGASLDGSVLSMTFNGRDLIAAGTFTASGLTGLSHIARWNTSSQTWSPMGSGTQDQVWAVTGTPNEIYAGGLFTQMGGKESDYFARWAQYSSYVPGVRK